MRSKANKATYTLMLMLKEHIKTKMARSFLGTMGVLALEKTWGNANTREGKWLSHMCSFQSTFYSIGVWKHSIKL